VAAIKPHLNDPIPAMLQPTQIAYAPAPTPPVKVMAVTTGSADASASRQLAMGTAPALQDDFTPPPPTPADDAIAVSSASTATSVDVASSAPQATSYTSSPAPAAWQQDSTVGGATIQIGAFSTQERAQRAAALAKQASGALANTVNHIDLIPGGANGHPVWRTRLAGLPAEQTDTACAALRQQGMPCVLVIGQ
jgi:hypothetical protein